MGIGDNIMATGMARGAAKRGKRVAFGDGSKIRWDTYSELIFRHNVNICPPASRGASNVEWIPFYRGNRLYNRQGDGRWIWNYDFRPTPGEFFLTGEERKFAEHAGKGFVLIEPNLPPQKTSSPNKQWPQERYAVVAHRLAQQGHRIVQLAYGRGYRIPRAVQIATPNFRLAAAVLQRAALYIGPEGGLHHAAAALDVPGVVIFGGWVPPEVTGYAAHANLTGDAGEACGLFSPCDHCRQALLKITVDEVLANAEGMLRASER